jgi:hypothetical protein
MRPEDDLEIRMAMSRALDNLPGLHSAKITKLIAAVAPAIAAQEREACIAAAREALENYPAWDRAITPHTLMKPIEAAIRARGEAGDA